MPQAIEAPIASVAKVEFLWLEITNRCNLTCTHCYAESGPYQGANDLLGFDDYARIMEDAYANGCRQIQFIGGEPTLNRDLAALIERAHRTGFDFIEVFSNLVQLKGDVLEAIEAFGVEVATSFYSDQAEVHDAITGHGGSFEKTVRNIKLVVARKIPLRAGIIVMDQNRNDVEAAAALLRSLGVANVGSDVVRGFGRAQPEKQCAMNELCGQCAGNILAIGPDGVAAPCIMSKHWAVGNVRTQSLAEILSSRRLSDVRAEIATATAQRVGASCGPATPNCYPECSPMQQCIPCSPHGSQPCGPNGNCSPAGGRVARRSAVRV